VEFAALIWCGCRMDNRLAFARGLPNFLKQAIMAVAQSK
jgi:hypothetical protein